MKNNDKTMKFINFTLMSIALAVIYLVTDNNLGVVFLVFSIFFFAYKFQKSQEELQKARQARNHYRKIAVEYEERYKDGIYTRFESEQPDKSNNTELQEVL